MKRIVKPLSGLVFALALIFSNSVQNPAHANILDKWESSTITCTVTITYGGGPLPFSYQETYQGTKRKCVSGWGLCITDGICS